MAGHPSTGVSVIVWALICALTLLGFVAVISFREAHQDPGMTCSPVQTGPSPCTVP